MGHLRHTANALEIGWTLLSLATAYFGQLVLRTRVRDWQRMVDSGQDGIYRTLALGRLRTVCVYLFTALVFVGVGISAMLTPPNPNAAEHAGLSLTAILLSAGIIAINVLILVDEYLMGRDRQSLIEGGAEHPGDS